MPLPEAARRMSVMGPELGELALMIVRWVDDYQPGIVACEFVDADGRRHTFIGKLPIFSTARLDANSTYPQPAALRCAVLRRWTDSGGRELVMISTAEPDDEESTEGLAEFVVPTAEVSRIPRGHGEFMAKVCGFGLTTNSPRGALVSGRQARRFS